jgi:hypothetical protein
MQRRFDACFELSKQKALEGLLVLCELNRQTKEIENNQQVVGWILLFDLKEETGEPALTQVCQGECC